MVVASANLLNWGFLLVMIILNEVSLSTMWPDICSFCVMTAVSCFRFITDVKPPGQTPTKMAVPKLEITIHLTFFFLGVCDVMQHLYERLKKLCESNILCCHTSHEILNDLNTNLITKKNHWLPNQTVFIKFQSMCLPTYIDRMEQQLGTWVIKHVPMWIERDYKDTTLKIICKRGAENNQHK